MHAWHWATGRPIDPYYHRKVIQGLLVPTFETLDRSALRALWGGRVRADGRRLDSWVVDDPTGREEAWFA
jgi:hypothetical protein